MKLIERFLDVIAPYNCVGCGLEGSLLCQNCQLEQCEFIPPRCYRCKKLTQDFATCEKCRSTSNLRHLWVRTEYSDAAKKLIYQMKFKSARDGAKEIAVLMDEALPILPKDTIVVHVPTVGQRRRQRGFDHAEYIAHEFTKRRQLNHQKLLGRQGNQRQVGASREVRLKQLEEAFYVRKAVTKGYHVLLVDDIVTTGGTLEAAAKTLKQSGAVQVDAVVFAQK